MEYYMIKLRFRNGRGVSLTADYDPESNSWQYTLMPILNFIKKGHEYAERLGDFNYVDYTFAKDEHGVCKYIDELKSLL